MENLDFYYKGYLVEIENKECKYVIKKDGKMIFESSHGFPFPSEAEIDAKLYINRLITNNDGWVIS